MTEVEQMWKKLNEKFGTSRDWHSLTPHEQHDILTALNVILIILHTT